MQQLSTEAIQKAGLDCQFSVSVYDSWLTKEDTMLPAELASGLVLGSIQEHIIKSTPRDRSERFVDMDSVQSWFNKGRRLYVLNEKVLAWAGIVWFEPLEHPQREDAQVTFATRLYEGAVGRGLARPFMAVAHADLAIYMPNAPVWLSTDVTNEVAQHNYKKFGYAVSRTDGERVYMIHERAMLL